MCCKSVASQYMRLKGAVLFWKYLIFFCMVHT